MALQRGICIVFMPYYTKYLIDVQLCSHCTLFGLMCTDVRASPCYPMSISMGCIAQLCIMIAFLLLCRPPRRRWWLKVSAESGDTSLLPSTPMEPVEGIRDIGGEIVFSKDVTSNLTKAVSGTEWMYHRGALARGTKVSACVCAYRWVWMGAVTMQCTYVY